MLNTSFGVEFLMTTKENAIERKANQLKPKDFSGWPSLARKVRPPFVTKGRGKMGN